MQTSSAAGPAGHGAYVMPSACRDFYRSNGNDEQILAAIQQRWQLARRIARLPPLNNEQLEARSACMWDFNHRRHAITVVNGSECIAAGGASFAYLNVWKSANTFMEQNIRSFCHGRGVDKTVSTASGIMPAPPRIFTFVRNPWSHFVSGYRETTLRTFRRCCVRANGTAGANLSQWKPGVWRNNCTGEERGCIWARANSTALARTFIQHLLDANFGNVHALNSHWPLSLRRASKSRKRRVSRWRPKLLLEGPGHMNPQAGAFSVFMPGYVGRLETFEADWDAMRGWNGFPPTFPPKYTELMFTVGHHPSSDDPLGRGAAMVALAEAEPHLRDAVLELLRVDYDCFYPQTSLRDYNRTTAGPRSRSSKE